jgi:hypothetical protein
MILSTPAAIEDTPLVTATATARLVTPKSKINAQHSNFDANFPVFPEISAVNSGGAKYEVFMAPSGGGRVKEIKVCLLQL